MAQDSKMPHQSGARRMLQQLKRLARREAKFVSSADYWETRYLRGGSSGAGSYNRLAEFKADVLNKFVSDNDVQTIIEFGSGDGAQLELAKYPQYIGVDVARTALEHTREKFKTDPTKQFLHPSELSPTQRADLCLSLDVVYHLVEDQIFESYMKQLFESALKYVIVYSSNYDMHLPAPHVRHREFTRWVQQYEPSFNLVDKIVNPYPYSASDPNNTSFADFYVFARC